MKRPSPLALLVAAALLPLLAAPAHAATLLEIYQQALQRDPTIREADARRLAALEASPQARSVYLPQIGFGASYETATSDGSGVTNQAVFDDNRDFIGVFPFPFQSVTDSDTTQWSFSLRQTIFRWDQIIGLKQAEKQVARAETVRESAQQDLIVRVVTRYFNVLAAEDTLLAIHANRRAIARQLEQAKQRFEVGLIAVTDVQESQAAFDQATADEIQAKRELASSRFLLREITGEYIQDLAAPGESVPLRTPDPLNVEAWVDQSMAQNLDLLVSRIDEQLARDEIASRRNGHLPTVDLVAGLGNTDVESKQDTGLVDPDTGLPVGALPADRNFDSDFIRVEFNLPLFAGGGTTSRVREAVYLHRASREALQRVTRETESTARDSFLAVETDISRVQALRQAVQSSRTALEATEAGFEVGTRTIVQVLDQQFLLYDNIVRYYRARYDYILNSMRLKQAAGSLSVQDLEALEPFLNARKTPEQRFQEEAKAIAAGEEPPDLFEGPATPTPETE